MDDLSHREAPKHLMTITTNRLQNLKSLAGCIHTHACLCTHTTERERVRKVFGKDKYSFNPKHSSYIISFFEFQNGSFSLQDLNENNIHDRNVINTKVKKKIRMNQLTCAIDLLQKTDTHLGVV